ncbi:metallophosphoesterase [Autumnicola musiva]|uniref:Metallophosphoesterase n=1 Tax=Autumnicola musiva TaxID=3075589 RepID=A0ABU3D913_9FLAO|nr:metallophosphoesterase [Zunongwangia sp. F117]MDT0678026.1 metallophosphoesterase [Zunongwangia sp. F117]
MRVTKLHNNRICNSVFLLAAFLLCFSASGQDSFEFVVLPDTQTYVEEYPEIYLDQMQWIAENKDRFSFALHVGDITQNNNKEEWETAKKGFQILKGKVPFAFALGNHDMGSEPGKFADVRNTTMANQYFSPNEIPNLVESFPKGTVENLCSEFNVNGKSWMVLSLEFGPRNKTVEWANEIISRNKDHNVILVTHAYLFSDSTLHDKEDWWQPKDYGIGKEKGEEAANNGRQLWEKLISQYENIKMVFSGHILKSGVGTLVSTGKNGNKVYQMLANYQKGVEGSENGGNGFLRIIEVKDNTISVKTYSPWLQKFKEQKEHNFSFTDVELQ